MARNTYNVDESLQEKFNFTHLKNIFKYVKKYRLKMFWAFLLSSISVVLGLLPPALMQKVFDEAVPAKDVGQVVLISAILGVCIVGSILFVQLRAKIMVHVSNGIIYDIRKDLFAHLQKLPFKYYDDRPHGKILVRVLNYVNSVSDVISNGVLNLILELISIIFITIFMFSTNVTLSLVILAGVPFVIAIVVLLKPRTHRAWRMYSNKSSNYTAYVAENISGIKIIQSFGREKLNRKIFDTLINQIRNLWVRVVFLLHATPTITDAISMLVTVAIYAVGILWLGPQVISFGVLLAMTSYASRFWQPIVNIANIYNSFVNTIAYLERIFETMQEPVTIKDIEGAIVLPEIKGDVSFKNVTFAYDEETVVLDNLSFDVKAGENIAIVGPTGAGKTTIVNLLSRFYNLSGGSIHIDGTDISTVTLSSLRSQMGIMLQDSFIFSGTVRENIAYGKLDATDDEIIRALHIVHAADLLDTLPNGLNTRLNEGGSNLSQGQRQLISFARTVVSDPKILVLDEATSSIDTKTEQLMQESINSMMKNRTSFIIAHRLSTIRNCDKIMYVNNKTITECGSHDELMAKQGDYYKLYTTQIKG